MSSILDTPVDAPPEPETSSLPSPNLDASTEATTSEELPLTIIRPETGWLNLNLPEVWRYRDLATLLIWRDIASRYRQSIVGYGWAVIKSGDIPYPLFAFSGLLPWMYFSGALASSTQSVVAGGALLQKVYFPRLILPLVSVVVGLVELAIQLVVLALLMAWFAFVPQWQIVLAPLFVLAAALTALSVGLWLTALNVKYRDVGLAVPFLTQAWMWMCPIVYPSSNVPEHLRPLYGLNPMVGVIDGFRWSIVGQTQPDWRMIAVSLSVVAVLLVSGLVYFRKTEQSFADII